MNDVIPERLSLRKNISWSFLGLVIYDGSQWLMLMFMTKLLPVEHVGMFVLASAIITPIIQFTNLQLRPIQGSDVRNEYCFGDYFALRIITILITIILSIIIALFLRKGCFMFLVMVSVIFYKAADSCVDITYGLLQKYERLDRVAISRIFRGLLGATIFVGVLLITKIISLAFAGVALAWMMLFSFVDVKSVSRFESIKPRFDAKNLRKLAFVALPLGITMALVSLNSAIPRYFTEKYLGIAQLGYFGAVAYLIAAMQLVMASVGPSALPRLSDYYINNKTAYMKLIGKMCTLAFALGLIGVLGGFVLGKFFLTLVYTQEYAKYSNLFIWLLVAGGAGYVASMLGVGLTAARIFKTQIPLSALTATVLVIASIVLIPRYEATGAAGAMLAGNIFQGLGAFAVILWRIHCDSVKNDLKDAVPGDKKI